MKFDPEYLKAASEKPNIKAIKQKSYSLMEIKKGDTVLDIGCGPGIDTINIAQEVGVKGLVYGIDIDPLMINLANEATKSQNLSEFVFHQVELTSALPFKDNTFDACRCERVLQHLSISDGKNTVQEAARVTKPGGKLVFIDTDWCSLSIHSQFPYAERSISYQILGAVTNGYAARGLPELFNFFEIQAVNWELYVLKLSFRELMILISPFINRNLSLGLLHPQVWKNMVGSFRLQDKSGVFFSTINMIMCDGTKR